MGDGGRHGEGPGTVWPVARSVGTRARPGGGGGAGASPSGLAKWAAGFLASAGGRGKTFGARRGRGPLGPRLPRQAAWAGALPRLAASLTSTSGARQQQAASGPFPGLNRGPGYPGSAERRTVLQEKSLQVAAGLGCRWSSLGRRNPRPTTPLCGGIAYCTAAASGNAVCLLGTNSPAGGVAGWRSGGRARRRPGINYLQRQTSANATNPAEHRHLLAAAGYRGRLATAYVASVGGRGWLVQRHPAHPARLTPAAPPRASATMMGGASGKEVAAARPEVGAVPCLRRPRRNSGRIGPGRSPENGPSSCPAHFTGHPARPAVGGAAAAVPLSVPPAA